MLGVVIHLLSLQKFATKMCSNNCAKFGTITMDPRPAPSRSFFANIQQGLIYKAEVDSDEVQCFPLFCREIPKNGRVANLLAEIYMVSECMEAFAKAEFVAMPYPHTVFHSPTTVPDRSPSGLSRATVIYGVVRRVLENLLEDCGECLFRHIAKRQLEFGREGYSCVFEMTVLYAEKWL